MVLAITFTGMLQVGAILAGYQLGRMAERPESKWPAGSLAQFGWKAWKTPLMVVVGLAVAITVLLPIMRSSMWGQRMLAGFGMGGYGGGGGGGYQAGGFGMGGMGMGGGMGGYIR